MKNMKNMLWDKFSNTEELLEQFFLERNSSKSTMDSYRRSVNIYEKIVGKTLLDILLEAEQEEAKRVPWRDSEQRKNLIKFRNVLLSNYKLSTAKLYLSSIQTLYHHFELEIGKLPYVSTKNVRTAEPIYYDDLPNREIIKEIINISSPLLKAIILFISSSGCSRIEAINLTVKSYLDATSEYHHKKDIMEAIEEMDKKFAEEITIVPMFRLKRQKTNVEFFTFCSPEAVVAINSYLKSRENLSLDEPLFKISGRYFSKLFADANDQLQLGERGEYRRFRPHMLRKYHASQLWNAGMSMDKIDLLQGRKKSNVHQSYFKESPLNLKEEYIKCLPYIVIDDVERFKTQLEQEQEKTQELTVKIDRYEEFISDIDSRLRRIEEIDNFTENDFEELLE